MKKEIADKLRLEYEYLWHNSMHALPDGWIEPLVKMLDRMEAALSEFHGQTQETCSLCGADGHLRMRVLGGDREGIFCEEHKDHNREGGSNAAS